MFGVSFGLFQVCRKLQMSSWDGQFVNVVQVDVSVPIFVSVRAQFVQINMNYEERRTYKMLKAALQPTCADNHSLASIIKAEVNQFNVKALELKFKNTICIEVYLNH